MFIQLYLQEEKKNFLLYYNWLKITNDMHVIVT